MDDIRNRQTHSEMKVQGVRHKSCHFKFVPGCWEIPGKF
jgi:hypothetical protein